MKYTLLFLATFLVSPITTFAAHKFITAGGSGISTTCTSVVSIQTLGICFVQFIDNAIVPFLFAIALLIFIFNVVRYFIIDNSNFDGKKAAKQYAIYSIAAFVIMVSIWGIVILFVDGVGLGGQKAVCPDTVPAYLCDSVVLSGTGGGGGGSGFAAPTTVPLPPSRPVNSGETFTELEAKIDSALAAVIAEMKSSELSTGDQTALNTTIDLLEDPNISDEVKIRTVESLHEFGYISLDAAKAYKASVDDLRALSGQPYITSPTLGGSTAYQSSTGGGTGSGDATKYPIIIPASGLGQTDAERTAWQNNVIYTYTGKSVTELDDTKVIMLRDSISCPNGTNPEVTINSQMDSSSFGPFTSTSVSNSISSVCKQ